MRWEDFWRYTAVNSKRGLGESGVSTVDRWEEVGVSTLYLCPSTSNVNRKTSVTLVAMSVGWVSKAAIGTEISWLVKLSDFAASCGDEGVVMLLIKPLSVLVMLVMLTMPPPLTLD